MVWLNYIIGAGKENIKLSLGIHLPKVCTALQYLYKESDHDLHKQDGGCRSKYKMTSLWKCQGVIRDNYFKSSTLQLSSVLYAV